MINHLKLHHFRSFVRAELALDNELVILHGPNGIGKTNLLESIYLASTTKSWRARDRDMVRYGENFYRVATNYSQPLDLELRFQLSGDESTKLLLVNQVKKTLHTILGLNPVVLFQPTDSQLFSGPSKDRRNLLDTILAQVDRSYARNLTQYKKILRQRNALLRANKRKPADSIEDQLFAWDVQIAQLALPISSSRQALTQVLAPLINQTYAAIAKRPEPINLTYQSSPEDLLNTLQAARMSDIATGHTTVGPHREDLAVEFRHHPLTAVASRGETRTLILAIKLAELAYIETQTKQKPILLLDDVFSELDRQRQAELLANVRGHQTIITTTEPSAIDAHGAQLINVAELAHES